jgi:UDP-N-acetylglucosamine 2-epimerase
MSLKIVTVVGARPQFIKAAPVSKVLRRDCVEVLVHTGQHYDREMSEVFFDDLDLPRPDYDLGVGSGSHGRQTGEMLIRLEEVYLRERPDRVLVYGDTNSTLAGALAAVKVGLPVAHVEAGLRSFNRAMPEEINRIVTDRLSTLLFCPTQTAVSNLKGEGITEGVYHVGDVMYDAVLTYAAVAEDRSRVLEEVGIDPQGYILATVHRPGNTDDEKRLSSILAAFEAVGECIVFPVHPRTRKVLDRAGITLDSRVKMIEPVGYLDMLTLERYARLILTDSGGVQKEAYFFGVPCLTLRDETEWVETVEVGWNMVIGTETERIVEAVKGFVPATERPAIFGDGTASRRIAEILVGKAFTAEIVEKSFKFQVSSYEDDRNYSG